VQTGEITKLLMYLHPFYGKWPTGQTRRQICTPDGQNDADQRTGVPRFVGHFRSIPYVARKC